MTNPLYDRLVDLRAVRHNLIGRLESERQAHQDEHDSLLKQVEALQHRVRGQREHIARLQQEIAEQSNELWMQEQQVLKGVMAECLTRLIKLGENLHSWQVTRGERTALLRVEPELERKRQDYLYFEENRTTLLGHLPESHRRLLVEAHDILRTQIEPYLELLSREKATKPCEAEYIDIVVGEADNSAALSCLLPLPNDMAYITPQSNNFLEAVRHLIDDSLINLAGRPDWHVSDLQSASSNGFIAVRIIGTYSGQGSAAEALQSELTQCFREAPIFEGISCTCRAFSVSLSWEVLAHDDETANQHIAHQHSGEHSSQQELPFVPDAPNPPVATVAEGSPTSQVELDRAERVDLPVSLPQTPPPDDHKVERIRRLLIHLVGHGNVGQHKAPIGALREVIAEGNADDLANDITLLNDAGVLISALGVSEEQKVAIHAERLSEIQDLINWDMTPFWDRILQSLESSAALP